MLVNLQKMGDMLRTRRQQTDATLQSTARQVGVSGATLSRLENGRSVDIETFFLVCQYLGARPEDFLNEPPK